MRSEAHFLMDGKDGVVPRSTHDVAAVIARIGRSGGVSYSLALFLDPEDGTVHIDPQPDFHGGLPVGDGPDTAAKIKAASLAATLWGIPVTPDDANSSARLVDALRRENVKLVFLGGITHGE